VQVVGVDTHTGGVDVAAILPSTPAENLRIPRAEFGRFWARAEQLGVERGPDDYYLTGVVFVCRWIARQAIRSPVTRAVRRAMPETLDTEYMAALAATRSSKLHPMRVEIARGTVEVLAWVGHGGPEPRLAPLAETG
jgi:hypothetical protein